MVSLAFGDVGPLSINALPSDVRDVAQQSLTAISQTAELHLDQPIAQLNISDAKFNRIIASGFHKLLQMCKQDASPLPAEVRRSCLRMSLKSLWYCARAYNRPGISKPLPSYFPSTLASPKIADLIRDEEDPVSNIVGRCFGALVVMKLVADVRPRIDSNFPVGDDELSCLAAVFDDESFPSRRRSGSEEDRKWIWDFRDKLESPGLVELLNVVFLASYGFNFLASETAETELAPSYALDVIRQTFSILSRALPAEINTEIEFDQILLPAYVSSDRSAPIIGQIFRQYSIKCLKNLWCRLQAYHQPGNSEPLPSYVIYAFAEQILVHCLSGGGSATSIMGLCVKALVETEPKPSTSSNVQFRDKKQLVAWYRAMLGVYLDDAELFLDCPGTAELATMVCIVFGSVGYLDVNGLPSEVRDVAQQTLAILSRSANLYLDQSIVQLDISDARFDRIIVSGIRNLLQRCIPGASTLTSRVRSSCIRISLMCLWYCARAYQRLDADKSSSAYFFSTLGIARPDIIHLLQTEQIDRTRDMTRCISTMVMMKLVASVRSRSDSNSQIVNDELACLSTILGTESDEVKDCLEWHGAVELATITSLALGDLGPYSVTMEEEKAAIATLAMLSQALPAENAAEFEPFTWDKWDGSDVLFNRKIVRIVVSYLHSLLQVHISGASILTAKVRRSCLRMFLRNLWYCANEYARRQPHISSFPSYFPCALASPGIIHRIQTEQDPTSRVSGRCFSALVVMNVVADIGSRKDPNVKIRDDELACLSTILGTQSDDMGFILERPGAIELVSMVSIALGDIGSLGVNTLPSGVCQVAQKTLAVLSKWARLRPDPSITQPNVLDWKFDLVIVFGLYDLLRECAHSGTSQASPLTAEVRRSCLRLSLNCLWYCAKAYHQTGTFKPMPSYFPSTLASPEVIRLIQLEQDPISRVTGRCFGALVVMNLAAGIRSSAYSNIQISDEELECLTAILGTENPDLKLWVSEPYTFEVANILSLIFSEIDILLSRTVPSEVLDMMQQTYGILARTLPAELNATLTNYTDGTPPLTEPIHGSQLRRCLENTWHCARTYSQLRIAGPLPSFVRITLASSRFIRRIRAEGDITTRVTGRCVRALIVNKLVDDFQSRISFSSGRVYDPELRCVSSLLDMEPGEFSRWPRPSAALKLQNVISLTLDIISSDLTLGGAFDGGDLPVDQVVLLREICSKIASMRTSNQFTDVAVDILEKLQQISKQLPTEEREDAAMHDLSL
ncbi:hypothetical protein V8E53_004829 [Lactarius tabidus]